MPRRFLATLAAAVTLTACTHTVRLALQPQFDPGLGPASTLAAARPAVHALAGQYADKRADTTMLASFKQGVHTYNLYGERPIRDALFDGLRALFVRAGHTWGDSAGARVRVDVELLNVQASRNAGLVSVGANSSIQMKVDFVEIPTGRTVYSEIYNGTDKRSQALVGFMGMVKGSLDQSIINCIKSIGDDAKLADALRQLGTPP